MNILLFLLTCVLTICVVILFTIVKEHEDAIVKLESLLNDVNKSIGTNTTIIRNHTDILNEIKEDIKILNNEVF